ncbi:predicted metal-dependent phosphoesterases [Halarchaeum acidiphilum MH1-52-1]|uniref:Predicted metal-dependent phosphoesterases n=1 Tax=Halarchaeum acidiphilum MH1-52-1 TaxID=1261545 RepID=U2YX30_9EURY|nr:PHP domain-containing protein [Halarchaeum acidiphilum]GAD53317.1 predicted metal-dependent phosphoesterases [Halarchaeum acidiphilum MH1-52-1]
MPHADLHVHTTASDGTLALDEVPAAARRAGVEAVAVTDHDTLNTGLDAPLSERDGIEFVRGIELRVAAPAQRVDLLGYGVRETPALREETARLERDRIERGRRIVANVESRLGIDLGLDVEPGFGRPHVARAVVAHPGTDYDEVGAVFDDLIGEDGPCYVARDVPTFERGRDLLSDACGAVGLAHPLRYADPDAALALCESLDAVEVHYPYDRPVGQSAGPTGGSVRGNASGETASDDADAHEDGPARVERAVERYDLLSLGGSDVHDETLGVAGIDSGEYLRLRRRIRG